MGGRVRFSCLQHRTAASRAPLPLSAMAVAIRENLAARRTELEGLDPLAMDLSAEVLAALHEGCHGRAAELRGTHSPEYRRRQLLGRDGLPVEGLAYLALHAPEAVVEALQVLARVLGYRMEWQEPDSSRSLTEEFATLCERSGTLASAVALALGDGVVTADEAVEIDRRLHVLRQDLAALEFAVHEVACGYVGRR